MPQTYRYTFDSVWSFAEVAQRPKPSHYAYGARHARWAGLSGDRHVTVAEVAAIANSGWDEGVAKLGAVRDCIAPPVPLNIRRRPKWGMSGDEVCMDRVRSGQLDSAWRYCPRSTITAASRNVTIAVDSIATCMADSEAMFWRGAAAVVLADALAGAGYGVQLVSAFHGSQIHEVVCRVVVKPYSAPLDLPTAAAGLAMPGFFRVLGHAWGMGQLPQSQCSRSGWYVGKLQERDVADLADGSVLFVAGQGLTDAKTAQAWVDGCLLEIEPDHGSQSTE